MDGLKDIYDALYGERVDRHVARDSNQNLTDEYEDGTLLGETGHFPRAFPTVPMPFPDRNRNRSAAPRTSRFRTTDRPSSTALTRDNYWKNNRPTLTSTQWATVTVHLPVIPPITETTEIKNAIFNSYTQRLSDADGEWTDKTSLFLSSFENLVPAASLEADVATTDFDNFGSGIFEFEAYECYNHMYEKVTLADGANFTANERTMIKWIKFALTIAPRQANVGHLTVDPNLFPSRRTITVLVRALLNANGNLHNSISKVVLRNRTATLPTVYTAQDQPFEPSIKTSESTYADPAQFNRILKQIKAETKFHAIKQIIAPVYVGRTDGIKSLTNRILAIDQSYYDPQSQQRKYGSVADMDQKMQVLLQEIDQRNPPTDLPDLEQTFFQGLHDNIKLKIIDDLTAGAPANLSQNLRRYNDIVRSATAVEEEQKRVVQQIQQLTRNTGAHRPNTRSQGRAPGGPRVFLATNHEEKTPPSAQTYTATANRATTTRTQENTWAHTPAGIRFTMPLSFCAQYTGNTLAEDMIATSVEMVQVLEDEPTDGFAGVSIVEQALRNASGVRRPIKCFGCQGLPQYDDNAFHLWKDCPNKADQSVWKNFQQNLRRFREEKARRREDRQGQHGYYGPPESNPTNPSDTDHTQATTLTNWQRMGFPSKAMGEKIEAIADHTTKPTVRRALLATLQNDLVNTDLSNGTPETSSKEDQHKSEGKRRKRGPLFLLYMKKDAEPKSAGIESTNTTLTPRTMLAASNGKYPLRIAYNLPHLKFPIGDGATSRDRAFVTGLLDTGGCCMMGKLEWYTELHRVCPQLFDEFFELAERRYESINIGGLKDGIYLTHVAILWMPYEERGAVMRIEIGLSSELPVDTLFGVNFQKATKMTINLGTNKVESPHFGDSYDIVWRAPANADLAQIQHEAQRSPMRPNTNTPRTLAASSATEAEQQLAKLGKQPDGSKPVKVPKRVWRPKVTFRYEEPEDLLDTSEGLDWMFEDKGKVIAAPTALLPQRTDIIQYEPHIHSAEIEENIQWRDCPQAARPIIRDLIERHFDVFAQEGMQRPIRGFEFQIDTGQVKPITCKVPVYGSHEERVIIELVKTLQRKGLIEDDDGPWGSPIVLASKPNQGHVHWSQYVFRLCVSYRALNAITRPFLFPVRRCDEAIEQIGSARHVVTMDLDAGYWQMKLRESSRPKTAFYTPRGKKRWRVTPMGATNAHPAFVAMAMRMEDEWTELYRTKRQDKTDNTAAWLQKLMQHVTHKLTKGEFDDLWTPSEGATWQNAEEPDPRSAVIVDDIILAAETAPTLFFYLACVLSTLQFYRVTVKLRKTRFFPRRAEFVGVDVLCNGNSPAEAKNEAITRLERPTLFTDLRMLIGFIGFYRNWIPLYETRISPWRRILKKAPAPGDCSKEEEAEILKGLWTAEDRVTEEKFKEYGETNDQLMESLKQEILAGPVLKRPDPDRRFYVKTDWSAWAQGAVLLQAETTEEAEAAMWNEVQGGQCTFDKAIEGLRLRPLKFISMLRKEKSARHSFVGEASTGRWAFLKFKQHLIGQEFTWITDCSGVRKFFETDYEATHTQQRWKLELLRFDFTIVHRPGRMLTECDMLSRYNTWTNTWREQKEEPTMPLAATTKPMRDPWTTYKDWDTGIEIPQTPDEELTQRLTHTPRPIAFSMSHPQIVGPVTSQTTELATAYDSERTLWILNEGASTAHAAIANMGFTPRILRATDEETLWRERRDIPSMKTMLERLQRQRDEPVEGPQWMIIHANSQWNSHQYDTAKECIKEAHSAGCRATIITYCNDTPTQQQRNTIAASATELELGTHTGQIQNTLMGGRIEANTTYIVLTRKTITDAWDKALGMDADEPAPMEAILDINDGIFEDCNRYQEPCRDAQKHPSSPYFANVKGKINIAGLGEEADVQIVYDITHPLPNLTRHNRIMIEATNGVTTQKSRPLRRHELLKALGHKELAHAWTGHDQWEMTQKRLQRTTPRHTWERLLTTLHSLELTAAEQTPTPVNKLTPTTLLTRVINRWTTIPEPTNEAWKDATATDHDLKRIAKALETGAPLLKVGLRDKKYYDEWQKGKLELDEGIIYQYEEPKATKIRQLRRRVVPTRLRNVIITAYHATPLAGHTGNYKTYWRIAARFYWPGMSRDVRKAVTECGHCQAANVTGHEKQQRLEGLSFGEPFDHISIDIWYPGKLLKDRTGDNRYQKAILTCSCNLTGFISMAFISDMDAETAARLVFSHFFIPNGLPKLVIIDSGSEFKGMLITMCEILGVRYYTAAPEDHNAISTERFHRYLNKVQRIHQADTQSYEQWKMAALFAAYAWNASPIDGLDVIRSFAAKARTFSFPLDTIMEGEEERIPTEGEDTLDHLETMFPLWFRQKTLLKTLNDERRRRHREMMNEGRHERKFQPNDIVVVRTQRQSKDGKPAKLTLRTRGPYRVIDKAGAQSYHIQRIPALQSRTRRPGKIRKEAAMRLTKLPSTLVIHKRVNTADTRLTERETELVHNPLEASLGIFDFGKYATADPTKPYAFVKLKEMWNEYIDDDDETESDIQSESDTDDEMLQIRAEDKQTTKRKRKRQDTTNEHRPTTRAKTTHQEITRTELTGLHREIKESQDKLFIIKKQENDRDQQDWHVVQVDWEQTDHSRAKRLGIYFVKFYVRNATDAKRRLVCNCRYWPLIYELKHDGYFGQMIMIRPNKVEDILTTKKHTRGWYQLELNLAETGIIGPFNFTKEKDGQNTETHRIREEIWRALEAEVKEEEPNVDISNLRTRIPLA